MEKETNEAGEEKAAAAKEEVQIILSFPFSYQPRKQNLPFQDHV